jgi:hypothetical protein
MAAVALKNLLHRQSRAALALMPKFLRFAAYGNFVRCDYAPDRRLLLKFAESSEELEACFHLLHEAYVGSGFMRPDASGIRVNIFHALPTTTLYAKFDGQVVGTISLIRESAFGFPLQSIFDLRAVREKRGRIAEVSALAVDVNFRNTGGFVLLQRTARPATRLAMRGLGVPHLPAHARCATRKSPT